MDEPTQTLLNGDAFDLLQNVSDSSIDLILTDPPYGTTCAAWDKAPDFNALFTELWRVLKHDGAILLFAQNPVAAEIITQNRKNFRYEWIFEKPRALGFLNSKKMPLRCHELILVFYRALPTYNAIPIAHQRREPYSQGERRCATPIYGKKKPSPPIASDGARFPRDVVKYSMPQGNTAFHPTQKPIDLLRMLIEQYTLPGEIVLDPFAGSGSTLKAAQITRRRALGFEKDKTYYTQALAWLQSPLAPEKRPRKRKTIDPQQLELPLN